MADLGNVLGESGVPYSINLGGKTWLFQHFTKRVQAAFGDYVKGLARQELMDNRQYMDSATYAVCWAEFAKKSAAGEFSIGKDAYRERMGTREGSAYLTYLLLRKNHSDVTFDDAQELNDKYEVEIVGLLREMRVIEKKAKVTERKKRNEERKTQGLPPLPEIPEDED